MDERWDGFVTELKSGDSDRVNDVIDEIKEMELGERIELFDACFDELTGIYAESDDGYVRQSLVRVAERLVPGIPIVFAVSDDERSLEASVDDIRNQTDALCGFLLEAITDDDGRVRQSAKRGLKEVFRTYDALEDEETIEALARELKLMAEEYQGKQRKHLLEVKDDAEFFMQSGFARIIEGFQEEFGDSLQHDK